MFSGKFFVSALLLALAAVEAGAEGHSCVWKVTGPKGGTLYLGGSVHALSGSDYPLPAAFNRAFDASDRIAFEVDEKTLQESGRAADRAGRYRRGDSLKNHVDPRTYEYLRRFFAILKVPEEKYASYRPWYLALMLQAPQLHGLSTDLGVEGFLLRRARANHKPITGLESGREHMAVFSELSDRESEAVLLLTFIPQEETDSAKAMTAAWRRGDADWLARQIKKSYADFPAFAARVIDQRNRNWIPKIERFLASGHTYFVVVGAGHLGGPNGLLALLRARGCRIEQL